MAKVRTNRAAIEALVFAEGVQADVHRRMEQAEAAAKDNAPVLTGAYRDNLHLVDDPETGGVRLVSDLEYSLVVEARTGNLLRSLDAASGS